MNKVKDMAEFPELEIFHPLIKEWFLSKYTTPTDIQKQAWLQIAKSQHVLLTAPTGSGKTLTAFLWAINQLITGCWMTDCIQVLYISPLKALNNDIRINLLNPLQELKVLFEKGGRSFPNIDVNTRSGDTPASQRRKMLGNPPSILITTPESFNIILSSPKARSLLGGIKTVILDEIHAVVANKRGTHLITAVERLVLLCGEFQRVALSATVKPVSLIADFVAGYRLHNSSNRRQYEKRKILIIQSPVSKKIDLDIVKIEQKNGRWPDLIAYLKSIITKNKTTLIFTNGRRMTEKITRLINENEDKHLVFSHHGSLSKEIRFFVEQKLKQGELKAIVATSSLELGIDIGSIEQVILISTPFTVSQAIQRIGRAGHRVGMVARGLILPLNSPDIMKASIMALSIREHDIEQIKIPLCALDVLAQVIISMTAINQWNIDELYYFLKTSFPYHNLDRNQFNLVVAMLRGEYQTGKIRELKPRVYIDQQENTIQAREGMLFLLYQSGGTIPDRGYFTMRVKGTEAKIGELDEEFVWERSVGDIFTMGSQTWKIARIDSQQVEVIPVNKAGSMAPFWRAEPMTRDFHLSEKIGLFLEEIEKTNNEPQLLNKILNRYDLNQELAIELLEFLNKQKEVTGTGLPNRHRVVVEYIKNPPGQSGYQEILIHTMWGARINRPWAIALKAAWEKKNMFPLQFYVGDNSVLLLVNQIITKDELFTLVTANNVYSLLKENLPKTELFGACFRENAARALLLPRKGFRQRIPLWFTRRRAKNLLKSVSGFTDFPIVVETWRSCLHDMFDMENLNKLLKEIERQDIKVEQCFSLAPSPLAADVIWQKTSDFMYQDDTPTSAGKHELSSDIFQQIIYSPHLRPKIEAEIIEHFTQKIQRSLPGYTPSSLIELKDWIEERRLIPEPEWKVLVDGMQRDHGLKQKEINNLFEKKIMRILLPNASLESITTLDFQPHLLKALNSSSKQTTGYSLYTLIAEWLRFYGPADITYIKQVWGLEESILLTLIYDLSQDGIVIIDRITKGVETDQVCDAQNLEIILRMKRSQTRASFSALDIEYLPLFLVSRQGLIQKKDSYSGFKACLQSLFGYPLAAGLWESNIFATRIEDYNPAWLDKLLQESPLIWFGCGKQKTTFCLHTDRELFVSSHNMTRGKDDNPEMAAIFPEHRGKYSFWDLVDYAGLSSGQVAEKLWQLVWKGLATNNQYQPIRLGIKNKFKPISLKPEQSTSRIRRRGFNSWQRTRPLTGQWSVLKPLSINADLLENEEIKKDRVRLLLERYGLICKELMKRELPEFKWSKLFNTLRIMELSGEIIGGYFFKAIPGLQFISPAAFKQLQGGMDIDKIFWLNACDPASLCGIDIPSLKKILPTRIPTTHLVYHGKKLVLISKKMAREWELRVEKNNPYLKEYLNFFRFLLNSPVNALKLIRVKKINNMDAASSPYVDYLINFGFRRDYTDLILI